MFQKKYVFWSWRKVAEQASMNGIYFFLWLEYLCYVMLLYLYLLNNSLHNPLHNYDSVSTVRVADGEDTKMPRIVPFSPYIFLILLSQNLSEWRMLTHTTFPPQVEVVIALIISSLSVPSQDILTWITFKVNSSSALLNLTVTSRLSQGLDRVTVPWCSSNPFNQEKS